MIDSTDTDSNLEQKILIDKSEAESSYNDEYDIEASATDTDEDNNSNELDNFINRSNLDIQSSNIIKNLKDKYRTRPGKQLYVRFPHKIPADETDFQDKTKSLSTLIVRAHRPRQKHARFCLVDFKSKEDRDSALKSIRSAVKDNENMKGIVVSIPRTENDEFIKTLAEKKLKSIEIKRAKNRLKRESKQAIRSKMFTSSIVVINLPKSASISEVKKHFPNAVDIQIRASKGKMSGVNVATITLPSTMEARKAIKEKLVLGGVQLKLRFDTKTSKTRIVPKRKADQKLLPEMKEKRDT